MILAMQEQDRSFDDPNYNAALPAAGAWSAQEFSDIPSLRTPRRLQVIGTYTLGAGATTGQAKIKILWRIGNDLEAYETIIDASSPVVADPYEELAEYALVVLCPVIAGADSPFCFRALSVEVPSDATGVKVLAAEVGDTAHPGVFRIDLAVSDVL